MTADDSTPTTVHITDGRAVYWDGEQRTGEITGIPLGTAKQWLLNRWATIAYHPA